MNKTYKDLSPQQIENRRKAKLKWLVNNPEKRKKSFNDYWKRQRAKNPEAWKVEKRELAKNFRLNNLDDYRKMEKEKSKLRRMANPKREYEYVRKVYLKKFGLTEEIFGQMVINQGGKCAFCKGIPNKRLSIDHCHKTGKVRGLLCNRCNMVLGQLEKMAEGNGNLLEDIAKYLK